MNEAEMARDLHAVLARVQDGVEVVIGQNHRPVAVLRRPESAGPGRKVTLWLPTVICGQSLRTVCPKLTASRIADTTPACVGALL